MAGSRGFTLVELLVTVSITGLLAAISVAQFQNYREKAFDSIAMSEVKNMATGMHAYALNSNWDGSVLEIRNAAFNSNGGLLGGDGTFILPGYKQTKGIAMNYGMHFFSTYTFGGYAAHCKGSDSRHGGGKKIYEIYSNHIDSGPIHEFDAASWMTNGDWCL